MRLLRYGYVIAPLLGGAWMLIVAVSVAVTLVLQQERLLHLI